MRKTGLIPFSRLLGFLACALLALGFARCADEAPTGSTSNITCDTDAGPDAACASGTGGATTLPVGGGW